MAKIVCVVSGLLLLAVAASYAEKKLELIAEVQRLYVDENVITSPFLLINSIAQLSNGKDAKKLSKLESFSNNYIQLDSRLYVSNKVPLLDSFEKRSALNTNLTRIDFEDKQAIRAINNWVAETTKNKVKNIINGHKNLDLLSVSLILFDGLWKYKFIKSLEEKSKFFVPIGDGVTHHVHVTMMKTVGHFKHSYIPKLASDMVILPFAESPLNMLLIVPTSIDGIFELSENIENFELNNIIRKCRKKIVTVELPKLKLPFEIELIHALKQSRSNKVLDPFDLSHITSDPSSVKNIRLVQKGHIEFNDNGIILADINDLKAKASPRTLPNIIAVNRPFLFYILDNEKIYITGEIRNPLGY